MDPDQLEWPQVARERLEQLGMLSKPPPLARGALTNGALSVRRWGRGRGVLRSDGGLW